MVKCPSLLFALSYTVPYGNQQGLAMTSVGVKSSCFLRVPNYKNKFNERENIYTQGLLLSKIFSGEVVSLLFWISVDCAMIASC